jgi:hypothetical protein
VDPRSVAAVALAVSLVGTGLLLGWHGTDLAAAAHRVLLFRRYGFTLWDGTWYGGQWTLDYSVAFAPVAATLGLPALGLVSAGLAALSFERLSCRLVEDLIGPGVGRYIPALVFALGTAVQTAIGQYPFLAGEAVGLAALWAASRQRFWPAWLLAATASLLSPLAGAFVALGALAWLVARVPLAAPPLHLRRSPERRARSAPAPQGPAGPTDPTAGLAIRYGLLALAALAPGAVASLVFAGEGSMPFQGINCVWDVVVAVALWALTPRRQRVLRTGLALYAVALVGAGLIQSPVGVNAGRLEDCAALPVALALVWPHRYRLALGVVVGVPLLLSDWAPAWGAVSAGRGPAWDQRSYYAPLDRWLASVDPGGVDGRVEAVPTVDHAESEWVADVVPLARGWERQTDIHLDPIFYTPGALSDSSYLTWLRSDGVRYVALADAPPDFAATAEARLLRAGVPGLAPVWRSRHWRVWEVSDSPGLAGGGTRVLGLGAASISLRVPRAEAVVVRVRWNGDWRIVRGAGCLGPAPGGWSELDVPRAGPVELRVELSGTARTCPR